MNGSPFSKIAVSITVSAIVAIASILWSINARIAVIEDRMSRLLDHSDKADEAFDRRVSEDERRLRELELKR